MPGDEAKITRGDDIMDLKRFEEDTTHMIVFDVLKDTCPVGFKGERIRIFLSEDGYEQALRAEDRGEANIMEHFRVHRGNLIYDGPKRASGTRAKRSRNIEL